MRILAVIVPLNVATWNPVVCLRMYVYQNGNSSMFKVVELIKLRNYSYTYVKFTTETVFMHNRWLFTTFLETFKKLCCLFPGSAKYLRSWHHHLFVFKETHDIRSRPRSPCSFHKTAVKHLICDPPFDLNCHKISPACRNAPFLPWYFRISVVAKRQTTKRMTAMCIFVLSQCTRLEIEF